MGLEDVVQSSVKDALGAPGRREDEEELDEMSSMAGGGGAGYSLPLGMRAPKVAGSEKKKKRHPKDFLGEDELVNEVMDYLLGITVG